MNGNRNLKKKTENIDDFYSFIKILETSPVSTISQVKNIISGELRICKKINKFTYYDISQFNREIDILIESDDPQIINLIETFEDDRQILMILENCTGGSLLDKMIQKEEIGRTLSEKEAAIIFKQILSAIAYLHSKGIVYGDLKPENFLFLNSYLNSTLKLIDFSSCQYLPHEKTKALQHQVGTALYMSPEMVAKNYNKATDIWSAGVLLYIMLSGFPPFIGLSDNDIKRSVSNGKFHFPSSDWDNISENAKDLIKRILSPAERRITNEQIFKHPWLVNNAPNCKNGIVINNVKLMKNYSYFNKFKKTVLLILAKRLKDEEIQDLKDKFYSIDTNNDGSINLDEFRQAFKNDKSLCQDLDVDQLFKSLDINESGYIDYSEFIAATLDRKRFLTDYKIYEIFKSLDQDGNGTISLPELSYKLNITASNDYCQIEENFRKADKNNDLKMDFKEFMEMLKKK